MAKGYLAQIAGGSSGSSVRVYPSLGLTLAYVVDDFCGGSDTRGDGATVPDFARNGSIGQLGWVQREDHTSGWTELGYADTEAEHANHPGILYLGVADEAFDTSCTIMLARGMGVYPTNSPTLSPILSVSKTFHVRFILSVYQIQAGTGVGSPAGSNTSLNISFGIAPNPDAVCSGISFAYSRSFNEPTTEFPPTHWHLVSEDMFDEAFVLHTDVEVDTAYHLFEILHTGGTNDYQMKIDGAVVGTITYDYEAGLGTALAFPYISIHEDSQGNSSKYMAVDYFDLLTSGLSRGDGLPGPITWPGPVAFTFYEIALAPGSSGNFDVAHALGGTPTIVGIKMTSDGAIWTQTPDADGTNLKLTASSGGITGKAVVSVPAPPQTIYEIDLAPGAGGNFTVAHGLAGTPQVLGIKMTSDGAIWTQTPEADGTDLKLTASSGGITGKAVVTL